MFYSGADLIRTSGLQNERAVKLNIAAAKEVKPPAQPGQSNLDEGTKGALLRFARFVNKDGKRPPPPSQKKASGQGKRHPYIEVREAASQLLVLGQNLDIYA
jgi:hypothetical protein